MSVQYRVARASDLEAIVEFQLEMARETEGLDLELDTCRAGVRAVFDDATKGRYHVAELDGQTVASLLIIPEWSDWRNGTVWWIHSVYVRPELRGRGIYSGLYRHIQKLAEADEGIRGLRLYVDKRNTAAQAVYSKLGMNADHYLLYEWMKTF